MKLLITTQIVDKNDPTLGFFHRWIEEFAKHYESIEVICLFEGVHSLPANVHVHSLGKEKIHGGKNGSRIMYAIRLKALAFKLRHNYDAVFVHMNQEHILVAGPLWCLLGKRIYMWRNHYAGSVWTDIAAIFCTKVFCTSKYSYTAKYKKTTLMPVGVDTERFSLDTSITREPRSILFFARISPSKRPDIFIEALGLLIAKGVSFVASVYGSPNSKDTAYYESLKTRAEALGLHDRVQFHPGVSNEKAADIYPAHDIFVNCSPSGMFDKTLFEAAASGCLVLASSKDYQMLAGDEYSFPQGDATVLAERLQNLLGESVSQDSRRDRMVSVASRESLPRLLECIVRELE